MLEIDDKYGTWDDIKKWSQNYKIILDGIFNHIGINSSIFPDPISFKGDFDSIKDYYYIYPESITKLSQNMSTRGGSVFRRTFFYNNTKFTVWQTFSNDSIDLNLFNPKVQNYIDDFLILCKEYNVWGIRLDAVAYYYKEIGIDQLHHPKAIDLARIIANKIKEKNINVIAQLDSDSRGLAYFPKELGYRIPVCDYSFTSYLVFAHISGCAVQLSNYLISTADYSDSLLRTARNHDGILLRSRMFDMETKKLLIDLCKKHNINYRITNNTPYEINYSFPYLCKACSSSISETVSRNQASSLLVLFQRGISYIYFPQLINFMPEEQKEQNTILDPRGINRQPIELDFLLDTKNKNNIRFINLFKILYSRLNNKNKIEHTQIYDNSCLIFSRLDAKLEILINFSHTKKYIIKDIIQKNEYVLYSSSTHKNLLYPGNYAIISIIEVKDEV